KESSSVVERVCGNQEFFHNSSSNDMFLNDSFECRRIARAVPRTFRIDDRNRAALTDAKAVRLRAKDPALLGQTELLQSSLQEFPGREASFLLTALRRRLIAAEKDVAPGHRHADVGGDLLLGS